MLASLTPAAQHLVMIGDHLQLRPKTQVYQLAAESNGGLDLDISLFERLVTSGTLRTYTLQQQRRMRPCIANLIRNTIYPELQDHPSVLTYPDVRGMAKPLFFFDHDHKEDGAGDDDSMSKSNQFEVDMVGQKEHRGSRRRRRRKRKNKEEEKEEKEKKQEQAQD